MIDAAKDSSGVDDEGVEISGPQIDGRKALHNFICESDGRINADLERRLVGQAYAVGIGDLNAACSSEALNLMAGPVDQDHFHAQRTKHGEVEEDVREVL